MTGYGSRCAAISESGEQCTLGEGHPGPHQLASAPPPLDSTGVPTTPMAPPPAPAAPPPPRPVAYAAPPVPPSGAGQAFSGGTGYPVRMPIAPSATSMNRLWGIPILGVTLRALLAIPVAIIVSVVGFAVALTGLVSWIPVLFTGRQAGWVYGINAFYLDWSARLSAYVWLLVGGYPISDDYGCRVLVDRDQKFSRLWGIPLLGVMVRSIILFPHYIVLVFLGFVAGLLTVVSWVPVLLLGRQAGPIVEFVGGYLRWTMRVSAYLLLVAAPYPPFTLSD